MHFTSYKREVYTQKEFNICIVIFVANKQNFIKSYDLMKLFICYIIRLLCRYAYGHT